MRTAGSPVFAGCCRTREMQLPTIYRQITIGSPRATCPIWSLTAIRVTIDTVE